MITISNIQIYPINSYSLKVSWEFDQTLDDFREYEFTLERSESGEDGFIPVFSFNHALFFTDDVEYRKIWRSLYYRILSRNTVTNETAYSKVFTVTTPPDLEALEIIRRNEILLKNKRYGTGSPIVLFKLKTVGPKCPVCWDYNKQKVRSSSCDECFKTGIEGGFYPPIITWANLTPPQKIIQLPQWGEMEPNEQRIFMNNEPSVNPKDILLIPSSLTFYQVERVETSTRREHILHQIISASGLDRGSIVYSLLDKYSDLIETVNEFRKKGISIK